MDSPSGGFIMPRSKVFEQILICKAYKPKFSKNKYIQVGLPDGENNKQSRERRILTKSIRKSLNHTPVPHISLCFQLNYQISDPATQYSAPINQYIYVHKHASTAKK